MLAAEAQIWEGASSKIRENHNFFIKAKNLNSIFLFAILSLSFQQCMENLQIQGRIITHWPEGFPY